MRRNNAKIHLDLASARFAQCNACSWNVADDLRQRVRVPHCAYFLRRRERKVYGLLFGDCRLFLSPSSHSHAVLSKHQKGCARGLRRRFFPVSAPAVVASGAGSTLHVYQQAFPVKAMAGFASKIKYCEKSSDANNHGSCV